jgi:hypothetical protein
VERRGDVTPSKDYPLALTYGCLSRSLIRSTISSTMATITEIWSFPRSWFGRSSFFFSFFPSFFPFARLKTSIDKRRLNRQDRKKRRQLLSSFGGSNMVLSPFFFLCFSFSLFYFPLLSFPSSAPRELCLASKDCGCWRSAM